MTNQEVVDRIADALRDVQMVMTNGDQDVLIFCEDKLRSTPGKTYLFHITMPLMHYKVLFESSDMIPPQPPVSPEGETRT